MKPYCLLFLFLLAPLISVGQTRIDSLKDRLQIEMDSLDMEDVASSLSMIGNEFLAAAQYDSALDYYYRSLAAGKGPHVTAATLNSVGIAYNFKGKTDSCIVYYKKALEVYRSIQDSTREAILEINLSIIYKNMGLYDLALESAFSALRKVEGTKDQTLGSLYNNIGSIYLRIDDTQSALEYFKKSLRIRQSIGNMRGVGQSYTNIGELFVHTGQYDSALANLLHAASIKANIGNRSELGSTLNSIGLVYLEMRRYPEAESNFLEALEIKRNFGEKALEGFVLNNIGKLRLRQGRYVDAEIALEMAHSLLVQTHSLEDVKTNLEARVELFKATNRTREGLMMTEELLAVKDSLLNREKTRTLQAMRIQYETERKEQQIKLLERERDIRQAEIRTKQVWIGAMAVVIAIITVSTFMIVLQYREVTKSKARVELLLKELHHRVKNNLQILAGLFHLPYQNITDKAALQAVKEGEGRVTAMALIHKMLATEKRPQMIFARDYLIQLTDSLSNSFGFMDRNGRLAVECDEIELDVDKAIPVGLIVNELVSNAMKYAFSSQSSPSISVSLKAAPGVIHLGVSDNGMGFSNAIDIGASATFGLRLVQLLTKELKGKLSFSSDHGAKFQFVIPNP